MSSKHNRTIGETIRDLRVKNKLPLRKVAAFLDIDQSYLSKIERGERLATKDQILKIAEIFNVDKNALLIKYFSDRIVYDLKDEEFAVKALKVAEKKILYSKNKNS